MDLKKPLDFLENCHNYSYGTIKLNSKFYNEIDLKLFTNLWEHAKIRTSTDGGTNHLFEQVESSKSTRLPTFVSGDFDSIAPSVKKFFEEKNVELIHTPDQDETDFTKNLRILLKKAEASNLKLDFVAVHEGSSVERFDHKMANINTLFKFNRTSPNVFVFLIAGDSLTFLLSQGCHKINVDSSLRGEWCSLAPVGSPCIISTEGFLYDMNNVKMEFGGLVSTSNGFSDASVVSIENESPVLFSMGLKMLKKRSQ